MRTDVNNWFDNLGRGGHAMTSPVRTMVLLTALVVLAAGCAQSNGTIDRVQHNLVAKSDILFNEDGSRKEWYYRATTIDAPYASGYSFIGDQVNLERGVFDIQEDHVYFYRVYTFTENEHNDSPRPDSDHKLQCAADGVYCDANGNVLDAAVPCNCDGDYLLKGEPVWMEKNAPLLAYPVEDHVDVIWEYNPNTGERTNVKTENTEDRVWWEREFIRVDWGANEMPSWAGFAYFRSMPGVEVTSKPTIFKDDGAYPDLEPRLTPETGYMDFVDEWIFEAATEWNESYGLIPLCWYYPWYSGGIFECVSEKITIRNAFLQVDVAREAQYEPQVHSDFDMERFGYFRTERLTWDKWYGSTYSGIIRYAYRFDIWEKDENETITGLRPIVYYLSEDYPDDLVEEANLVAEAWDIAFADTVRGATGKNPADFGVDRMFVVCENNLAEAEARTGAKAGLDAPCDVTEEPKRTGDLRYNFLHAIEAPQDNGLYGFGPMSADPLSGRIVTASAYNWAGAMKRGAAKALNRIEFLAGIKTFRELARAEYISQEVKFDRLRQTYWKNGYTDEEAQNIAQNLVPGEVAAALEAAGVPKTDGNFTQARLNILADNPEIESLFISDDVKMLFKDPAVGAGYTGISDSQINKYALRNWAHNGGFRKKQRQKVEMAKKGLDMAEFYDGALVRLSDQYKKRYDEALCGAFQGRTDLAYDVDALGSNCTVEDMLEQLRQAIAYNNQTNPYAYNKTSIMTPLEMDSQDPMVQKTQMETLSVLEDLRTTAMKELYKAIFLGVAIHEVGHNLGLRHNFEASTDAFNFLPEYWDLKVQKNGGKYEAVSLWSESPAQAAGGIRELQYSSVMDYYLKFNMPWHGVGLYDIAAIKYAYGDVMEVFASKPDLTDYQAYADANPAAEDPGNVPAIKRRGEGMGKVLYAIHPTEYPNLFGDTAKMYDRVDMKRSDVLGAACSSNADCGGGKVCGEFYEGMRCTVDQTVVPYRFGGDEMVGGLPTVDMVDEGVDPYEIVTNFRDYHENYWVFSGYWHGDATFWSTDYANYVEWIFQAMAQQYRYWVLQYSTYNHDGYWEKRFGKRWEEDINGGLSGAMASYEAFNTLSAAFGRPAAGTYGFNKVSGRYEPFDDVNFNNYLNQIVMLEEDGARPIYGYWNYDGYLSVVTSAGSIYDRISAFEALSDPETDFLALDENPDTRKYMINFGTVFNQEVKELFGGLMANNAGKYGWCVLLDKDQNPKGFAPRRFVSFEDVPTTCDKYYCGKMAEGVQRDILDVAPAADPLNAANPCGSELSSKGYEPMGGQPIEPEPLYTFPTTRFRVPMLAAYYGLSLLVTNFDKSFMDATRIWLEGGKFAINPPAGWDIARCEDRFSGRVYQAAGDPAGGYFPAMDLVNRCAKIFDCYDETVNVGMTEPEQEECSAIISKPEAQITSLTLDDLRNEYLYHDLQYLLGKIELIRSMHQVYEYEYSGPMDVGSGSY